MKTFPTNHFELTGLDLDRFFLPKVELHCQHQLHSILVTVVYIAPQKGYVFSSFGIMCQCFGARNRETSMHTEINTLKRSHWAHW